MRLLAIAAPSFAPVQRLVQSLPDCEITITTDVDVAREQASDSEVILLAPRFGAMLRDLWPMQHLRWIHTLGAGIETLPFDLLRDSGVIVTNSRGLYADGLAEFVIAAVHWFAKDLRRLTRNQEAKTWEPFIVERIEGQTIGVVGYGGIGRAVARRARALGMSVLATNRSGVGSASDVRLVDLNELLRSSNYVVLCVPLTPRTRNLLDRERISAIKPNAVVINVSRGGVIDEGALIDALRERRLRGAALDVFEVEPLPEASPLWSFENVLLSPHSADRTADSHDRAMGFFLENFARFRAGESLRNIVNLDEEY
jgi:phosphoglycerate dehydrogenase-like enzyme